MIISNDDSYISYDNFDRTNGTLGNGWTDAYASYPANFDPSFIQDSNLVLPAVYPSVSPAPPNWPDGKYFILVSHYMIYKDIGISDNFEVAIRWKTPSTWYTAHQPSPAAFVDIDADPLTNGLLAMWDPSLAAFGIQNAYRYGNTDDQFLEHVYKVLCQDGVMRFVDDPGFSIPTSYIVSYPGVNITVGDTSEHVMALRVQNEMISMYWDNVLLKQPYPVPEEYKGRTKVGIHSVSIQYAPGINADDVRLGQDGWPLDPPSFASYPDWIHGVSAGQTPAIISDWWVRKLPITDKKRPILVKPKRVLSAPYAFYDDFDRPNSNSLGNGWTDANTQFPDAYPALGVLDQWVNMPYPHSRPGNPPGFGIACAYRETGIKNIRVELLWKGEDSPFLGQHKHEAAPCVHFNPDSPYMGYGIWSSYAFPTGLFFVGGIGNPPEDFSVDAVGFYTPREEPTTVAIESIDGQVYCWFNGEPVTLTPVTYDEEGTPSLGEPTDHVPVPDDLKDSTLHGFEIDGHLDEGNLQDVGFVKWIKIQEVVEP